LRVTVMRAFIACPARIDMARIGKSASRTLHVSRMRRRAKQSV